MIHLDTSFLIRMLKRGSPEARFLEAADPDEPVVVSAIAWAEFLCGPIEPAEEGLALRIVDGHRDLTLEHAGITARLFNESGRRRSSPSDCLIAAVAIHDDARLATASLADFRRFASAGLKLV
ncbi:MAG: type II toxin-antitoxin system VapC family toxin [Acidobacteriia bacterium]|nr:type II toxin-antitoxin system VapC family toxin [Terriglobia bacterium]MYG02459.1 type II toxin-antitoxin system VapC family toxin [Terriglobia bacterium]MYK11831.1 type II toxin-antitoxin system VapC family toxin [Terriglobia bacterium]